MSELLWIHAGIALIGAWRILVILIERPPRDAAELLGSFFALALLWVPVLGTYAALRLIVRDLAQVARS